MKTAVPWALVVALAWVAIQGQCAQRDLDATREALAELRTDELEARAEAQGWRTQLVQATSELEAQLQDELSRGALLEEEKRDLAREIETLGGRLQIMADLYADARSQITAHAELHGDQEAPDSITAPVDDGLLEGRVAYFPAPREFDLEYSVGIALTAAVAEAPDGSGLLTLMATDPRVSLSYGEVLYQRPEPVRYCSLGQRAKAAGYGALGSELVQLILSSLTKE